MGFLLLDQSRARLEDMELNNGRQVGMELADRIQKVMRQESSVGTLFTEEQRGRTFQCRVKLL